MIIFTGRIKKLLALSLTALLLTSCGGQKINEWKTVQKNYGFERATKPYSWDTFCKGAFAPVFNAPEINLQLDPLLLSGLMLYADSSEKKDPNLYRDALMNNAFLQSILWPLNSGINLGSYDWKAKSSVKSSVGSYVLTLLDLIVMSNEQHDNLCDDKNKRLFTWNSLNSETLSKSINNAYIPSRDSINKVKQIASDFPRFKDAILQTIKIQNKSSADFETLKAAYGSPNLVRCKEYPTTLPGKTLIQCHLPN